MGGVYDKILWAIKPLLSKTLPNSNELYYDNAVHFAGHSLGGANAQIFGTYFAYFNPEVKAHVTTIAAPRQGNYAYKILGESIPNLAIWRIVNCRDSVPRAFFTFYHAGHLIWRRCNPPGEEELPNDVVEAYYRQYYDEDDKVDGYALLPDSWSIGFFETEGLASDHYRIGYMEWLDYALSSTEGKNWTSSFEMD